MFKIIITFATDLMNIGSKLWVDINNLDKYMPHRL